MGEHVFTEPGAYYVHSWAEQVENGKWQPYAAFQRKADFAAGKLLIPGMTHRLEVLFDTETAARVEAITYADRMVAAGEDVMAGPPA